MDEQMEVLALQELIDFLDKEMMKAQDVVMVNSMVKGQLHLMVKRRKLERRLKSWAS